MFFFLLSAKILAECYIENCVEYDSYGYCDCSKCIDGYIYDYSGCVKCHSSCKNCYDVTENYCSECYDGYYLYDRYGYGDGPCKKCSEDGLCAKCEQKSPYKCTDCIQHYYLDTSSKTPKCLPCDSTCETCKGPEANQCLTCSEGYIKKDGLCKNCADNCAECKDETLCEICIEKYFLDGSNQCQKCDDSCKTCHGTTMNDCDECYEGYYNANGLCRSCDPNCLECVARRNYCTKCRDGQYLDEEKHICVDCDSKCKTCKGPGKCDECADGYYKEKADDECKVCRPDYNCKTCQYTTDQYGYGNFYCTSCAAGYYPDYYYDSFTCESSGVTGCLNATGWKRCETCKEGYFKDGNSCSKCDKSCESCSDSATCTSCPRGSYLDESSKCTKCPTNCIDCNNATDCNLCTDSYYISNGICKKCDESCKVCRDDTNACIECAEGYYFNDFKRCVRCADNCLECTDDKHCTKCASEFFSKKDGSCAPCADVCFECTGPTDDDCLECDPGYYLSKSLKKCFRCHEACSVCDGPNNYDCTKCSPGYFLNKGVDIAPGLEGDMCTKCEFGCLSCTSPFLCTECQEGFYYKNNNCEHCSVGCKNCSTGVDKCTQCFDGYYASSTDGTFVNCSRCPTGCDKCTKDETGHLICNSCFDGYFAKDKRCNKCTAPCASCSSENVCTSCVKGHLFDGVSSCDNECSPSCAACTGTASSCTECKEGFMLNGTVCLECPAGCKTCDIEGDSASCTSCLEGFYLDGEKCKECYHECATCFDKSRNCYTCRDGYYKYSQNEYYYGYCYECELGTEHCTKCTSDCPVKQCIFQCLECENGYFLKDNKCEKCHESCKTCDGTTDQNCLSCSDEYILHNNKCEKCSDSCLECSTSPTTCASCRSHQYLSDGKCLECTDSCVECSDANTCTKCPELQFLHEGKCIQSCLSIGEGWGGNSNWECVKCNLDNCKEYDDGCQCTVCNEGYFIVSDPITLIEICVPCQLDNCKACNGPELNDCIECRPGFELQTDSATKRKVCSSLCEDGYFVNSMNECEKCSSPCKSCSGINGSICTQCEDGYILSGTKCGFFEEDCEIYKHCENENKGNKPVQITIEISSFNSFKNENNGGALRIVNCGLKGENTIFNECTSQKGGGGGIFILNDKELDHVIELKKMTFSSCKAAFGGAVYIYSVDEKNPVLIESCQFIDNDVYPSTNENKLSGGSAIYLTIKNGLINDCYFTKKGKLSVGFIKTTEDFDILPESLKILNQNEIDNYHNSITITDCTLKIDEISNSSFVYVVKKQTSKLDIDHYLSNNEEFSDDKKKELNNKFIEFGTNSMKKVNNNIKYTVKLNKSFKIVMALSSLLMIALTVSFVIKKRNQIDNDLNNNSIDSINA